MNKIIVFDLGGVLMDWNPRYLYRKIFSDPDEMEYFLQDVCSPEWHSPTDVDKSFLDAIDELIPQFPQYEDQIRAYYSRWFEMVAGDIPGSVTILKELKDAGYPLAALSNWSAETFPEVKRQYGFLNWFSPLVVSGYIGYKKPEPEPYQILLHELGMEAEDCLFIDDVEENIQEAMRQGFETIHFTSPEKLREELLNRKYL